MADRQVFNGDPETDPYAPRLDEIGWNNPFKHRGPILPNIKQTDAMVFRTLISDLKAGGPSPYSKVKDWSPEKANPFKRFSPEDIEKFKEYWKKEDPKWASSIDPTLQKYKFSAPDKNAEVGAALYPSMKK